MKLRVALPAVDIVSYFMTVQQGGIFPFTHSIREHTRERDGWVGGVCIVSMESWMLKPKPPVRLGIRIRQKKNTRSNT